MIELPNANRQRLNVLLLLKPVDVREIEIEREWFYVAARFALRFEKLLDRVVVLWIEMPVAGGAQVHPLRHVLAPELHRFSDDQIIDSGVSRLGGDCQPKRPCADNQQISFATQPSPHHACPSIDV